MATTLMTNDGKTQRTIDFYSKTGMYIGIGRTTAWTTEPLPDDVSVDIREIEELQAIKKIESIDTKYVRQQTGGEITFGGSEWTEVLATEQSLTATTISFTNPGTILDTGAGLAIFPIGAKIQVIDEDGTNLNEGIFTVTASTTTELTISGGTVDTESAGTEWTIKSNLLLNNVHNLFYSVDLDYANGAPDTLPLITYRQVGLLENPIDPAETICTGSVYTSLSTTAEFPQGILHYVDNRGPIIRTITQRETIQVIIEF